jgi:hypothetical protein
MLLDLFVVKMIEIGSAFVLDDSMNVSVVLEAGEVVLIGAFLVEAVELGVTVEL